VPQPRIYLYIHRGYIQRSTESRDVKGATTVTWSGVINVRCRIQPLTSQQRVEAEKVGKETTHKMYANTVVPGVSGATRIPDIIKGTQAAQQARHRVKFTAERGHTRYYEIDGVRDIDEWNQFTTLDLIERDDAYWNV